MRSILCSIGIIVLVSCAGIRERLAIKEFTFALNDVTPYDFSFSNLKVDFNIGVKNPNNVDALLDKFTYTFYVNNTDVFSGTTGKGVKIPAGKSTQLATTIVLEYSKIGEALLEALRLNRADYSIQARAYVNTILGEISYPVKISLTTQ